MKKYLKITAALMLMAVLCVGQVLPVKAWDDMITCTVLGDSIAKGYSSDKVVKIKSYGRIVTEQLAEENEAYFNYTVYAKNGMNTKKLNERVLSGDTAKRSLNQSDIILLTMGSNDLLDEFKKEAQEILNSDTKFKNATQALNELTEGVKRNPLTILKIVDALSNWDYTSFENEWIKAMDTITQQKKDTAQIIVTNIYNPVYNMKLPGTLNKVVENVIKNMNSIIEKRADEYEYEVVDLYHSNIVAFVQGDGLHPSQEGQELIAGLVYKEIEVPDLNEENSQSVDGGAVKGENQETDASEKQQVQKAPRAEEPNAVGPNAEEPNAVGPNAGEPKAEESKGEGSNVVEPHNLQDKEPDTGLRTEYVTVGGVLILILAAAGIGYAINRGKKKHT